MRYLGTLMVLACVVMLLLPSYWERSGAPMPATERAEEPSAARPGQSTLTPEDLIPEWRGPAPRSNEDG